MCSFSVRALQSYDRRFSWELSTLSSVLSLKPPYHALDLCVDLPAHLLLRFDRNPFTGTAYLLRLSVSFAKVRIINLISIDYAFRPRLRSRLTLGGRPLPQETLLNRCSRFSLLFVTHTGILTCSRSTAAFAATSTLLQRSPTTRIATNPKFRCHA